MNPVVPAAANNSHVGTFLAENEERTGIGSPAGGNAEHGGTDGTRAAGGCCAWASWMESISATSAAD
jgi:hypothetical protein